MAATLLELLFNEACLQSAMIANVYLAYSPSKPERHCKYCPLMMVRRVLNNALSSSLASGESSAYVPILRVLVEAENGTGLGADMGFWDDERLAFNSSNSRRASSGMSSQESRYDWRCSEVGAVVAVVADDCAADDLASVEISSSSSSASLAFKLELGSGRRDVDAAGDAPRLSRGSVRKSGSRACVAVSRSHIVSRRDSSSHPPRSPGDVMFDTIPPRLKIHSKMEEIASVSLSTQSVNFGCRR